MTTTPAPRRRPSFEQYLAGWEAEGSHVRLSVGVGSSAPPLSDRGGSEQSHGMMLDMPEQVPTCRRCNRPVVREANNFEVFERMHWSCFHYEFEHQAAGSADDDPDIACRDPGCPARAFDREAQPDWLTDK